MSYDVYLEIDTGGEYPATVCEVGNYTSNVSGMWAKALGRPLADFHGMKAADAISVLLAGVETMTEHAGEYRAMAPSNGWGSCEGARDYLLRLAERCVAHPKTTIRISR